MSTVFLPLPKKSQNGHFTDMLNDILSRIEARLKAVELSASAASQKAGISKDGIRNIQRALKKKGRAGVSTKTLEALAPILNTNVAWLMEGVGNEEGPAVVTEMTDVPFVSWISAGEMTHQEGVADLSQFPTVPAVNLPDGDWIALRVDGPSMNKISPPDAIIFVNMQDKRLVPNACYVICDETGKATYKRYRPNEEPQFQPASYEDIDPPTLEGAITIIGRVKRSIIDM